jgi:TetR/AcrR family transcriptional repressor of nem operon
MPKIKLFDKAKALEIAAEIFRTKGYNGTSVEELLLATGISRHCLYYSFRDKHNLYLQSIAFYKDSNYTAP